MTSRIILGSIITLESARAPGFIGMVDLFRAREQWEVLSIPDADISHMQEAPLGESDRLILPELIAQTPWRADQITLWGKSYRQPRLSAWYGDRDARYTYSGLRLEPLPWTLLLARLKASVEALTGAHFNSVLLNYYRDQRDSMGAHSDDEPELGPHPVIASLSFGETRTLVFKHRRRPQLPPVRLPLISGSLLLMKGDTQSCWKHGIGKQTRPCGARVNLTFRRIFPHPSR